ncbi:MAG: pitrilysin family protein [Planctomycetota bacterium]
MVNNDGLRIPHRRIVMPSFHEHQLSNGLRVVAEIDRRGYSAAFGYFVRSGSRDETDRQSGLSHFLEHMMFKGTSKRSAADVNRELDELGGSSNAYTSEEQTVYYATVLPKFQRRIVELLSDMLQPSLDADEFETERQVILEEIAKYQDQPPFGAFERSMECFFGPRGLGRRVLGTPESISAMTADDLRAYFQSRYRPGNIVLAATGNVDFDALVQQAETMTAAWSDRGNTANPPADDPDILPPGIALDTSLESPDLQQTYVVRLGGGPSMVDDDRYPAAILGTILGDEGGSRLFWDLIDTGRAEVATVWQQEFMDAGAWFTYLVCAAEDREANLRWIDQALERVVQDGVTDDELEQVTRKAIASAIMQSERPSNRLFGLGGRYLVTGEYRSLDDFIDRIRAVTKEQVNDAAKKYLTQDHVEITVQSEPVPS